jgi:uncharacterized FlaG/YvyC family protein
MSTEQLAVIVPSVTAIVVLVGNLVYQRWLTRASLDQQAKVTQKTLDQQALVTQKALDHERTIARDQRVQERIANTYEDMLMMLDLVMEIVRATQPILEPGPAPPPEPDPQDLRRVQARIGAHGSEELKRIIYERWIPERNAFFSAASYLAAIRQAHDGGRNAEEVYGVSMGAQYQVVQGHREQLEVIVRDLEEQVNRELRA